MFFTAELNPKAHIHKTWLAHNRVSGIVDGINFVFDGRHKVYHCPYTLNEEQVAKARVRQDQAIVIQLFGVNPMVLERPIEDDVVVEQDVPDPSVVKKPLTRRKLI